MMERNWNQLIERYLQHELSEEGNAAFELELQVNPELQMEFELHNLIHASAVRSVERVQIVQIGKTYHFYKTFKMISFSAVTVAAVATAAWFAVSNSKPVTDQPKPQVAVVTDSLPAEEEIDSILAPGEPRTAVFQKPFVYRPEMNNPLPALKMDPPPISLPVETSKISDNPKETPKPAVKEKEKEKDKLRSLVITTKFGFGKPVIKSRDANYLDFQKDGQDIEKESVYTDEEGLHIVNPKEKLHFVFERTKESEKEKGTKGLKSWATLPEPVEDTTTHKAVIRSVRND